MMPRSGDAAPCPDDATRRAALEDRRVFFGQLCFREDAGMMQETSFRLEVEPDRVALTYDDGIEHLTTNRDTVDFFRGSLVLSLRAAAH